MAPTAGEPPGVRAGAAHLPRPRADRDWRQGRRRARPALHLPRFPQAVHHRRDRARHATTHRPTRRRPPRHQHHHGIQGRLPRRGDQRPPGIHRPPPRTAPGEEYRTPTDEEWAEFVGHFEHRKVAVGDCGRSYDTPCIHEHSCLRCPLLRPAPAARPRLEKIRDNLIARIAEAESHRWYGEAEGLKVSLAGANAKLAQMDQIPPGRSNAVQLGIPSVTDTAGRTTTDTTTPPNTRNQS